MHATNTPNTPGLAPNTIRWSQMQITAERALPRPAIMDHTQAHIQPLTHTHPTHTHVHTYTRTHTQLRKKGF